MRAPSTSALPFRLPLHTSTQQRALRSFGSRVKHGRTQSQSHGRRGLATLREVPSTTRHPPVAWFTPRHPLPGKVSFLPTQPSPTSTPTPCPPPDPKTERDIKLGRTLRELQARLPTLLQAPLPPAILSPAISLHLFPSTHPHLPTVSGRVAYTAALWTAPIAWGRVPHVPSLCAVRLVVLSERMVKPPRRSATSHAGAKVGSEQLIVRWRLDGASSSSGMDRIGQWLGVGRGRGETDGTAAAGDALSNRAAEDFTGLFIFEFDEQGRIAIHTIEHVQHRGNWEGGVGKVVGLTDWLLGGMRNGQWSGHHGGACPACVVHDGKSGGRHHDLDGMKPL